MEQQVNARYMRSLKTPSQEKQFSRRYFATNVPIIVAASIVAGMAFDHVSETMLVRNTSSILLTKLSFTYIVRMLIGLDYLITLNKPVASNGEVSSIKLDDNILMVQVLSHRIDQKVNKLQLSHLYNDILIIVERLKSDKAIASSMYLHYVETILTQLGLGWDCVTVDTSPSLYEIKSAMNTIDSLPVPSYLQAMEIKAKAQ